ncbi:MAG: alpha/beta hydrolase [Proteobacteria bacterium]|nr:MAG: alpha/beta hydrolase [Pseudomonadota bacterium]
MSPEVGHTAIEMTPQAIAILITLVTVGLAAALFHVYRIRNLDLANQPLSQPLNVPPLQPPATIAELIPDSKYIEVDGAKLHYVQAGDGSDIVLLHGIGASVYIWRFLFPLLQVRHRVTAFDFAGFGKSSKDANRSYGLDAQSELIANALTKMGIDNANIVGSSMGGAIGFWMGKRWPERFPHIIGLGPATDSSLVPTIAQHFAIAAPLFRYTVNKRSIKFVLGYVVSNRKLITDTVVERYLEPFADKGQGLRAFVAATSVLSDRRLPTALADSKARMLIVWGAKDHLVPRRSMTKLRKVLPETQFIEHETGGHHIMEDEPVYTAEQIESFFAGSDRPVDPNDKASKKA